MGLVKLALVGDTHADEHSRFDEHNYVMGFVVGDAHRRGCSALLHSGDVFERKSTSLERQAVAQYLLAAASLMPVVVVAGNHDDPKDIELLGKLKGVHPIHATSTPIVVEVAGLSIACLPWPRRGNLVASLDVGREQIEEAARDALRTILLGLDQQANGHSRVLLAHAMVRGARITASQPPLIGADMELGLEELATFKASVYALGHIHLEQQWTIDGAPVIYPGAPRHCNWGELERKGYTVVTIDQGSGEVVDLEFVPTPCRQMVDARGAFTDGKLDVQVAKVDGGEVRVRYDVAPDDREAARAQADALRERLLADGATDVKVEEHIVVQTRARVAEVATAVTVADKLQRHWDAQEDPPDTERRGQLLAMLEELEREP